MNIRALEVGDLMANCFVAWADPPAALVIDPGSEPSRVLDCLRQERLTAAAYLLTHGHADHISALAELQETMPAPAAMHAADLEWAFTDVNQFPPVLPVPSRPPDRWRALQGGEELTDAGLNCRVLHTPGHSPGSVCFHFPDAGALFTGDTLFAGSVGRTDLPGGDSDALMESLARLLCLPATTRVYPGHGPETTLARDRRHNPFLRG
jgi:glyoxylase-like metal-dependent hydrolase (beta-lactamase superfamily II)